MDNKPVIIPVASGKGGVGKTLISVNIGYALAQLGKKTIIIDLDFGGANLHTCMGYETAPDGIGNFLNQKTYPLEDYLLTTTHPNLQIIPGDAEMVGIADISAAQKKRLINHINKLQADYIILDLGAGSSNNTVDFFMLSPFGIIVAMPELTSILNAYALFKNAIFRLLYLNLRKNPDIKGLFDKQLKRGGESAWKVQELMNKIFEIDPDLQAEASAMLDSLSPKLIINMATTPKDIEMGEKLRKISKNYLSITMEYLGFLYRDADVHKSILARSPIAVMSPENQTFQTILRMACKVVNAKKVSGFTLNLDGFENTLEEITEEASDDLAGRLEGYEELVDENLLTINELIVLVKNLEYENIGLKKEVESLKLKLLRYK